MFPFVINLRIVMSINQLVCIPSSQTWLPKNMRELKQYLFKLKWVVIKCYYVMASQIWQAQKDNAINKSYRRMHFMRIQKKPFSKAWFYHSIQSWIVQFFFFFCHGMHTITMPTFMCFADYWQTLSFWQIILIRLSQIVNAFEISLFSTLAFAKHYWEN